LKNICVIPARGGSKRIPRKNIRKLNGIPLINYTIQAAKDSKKFDEIIVSSDDEEILEISINQGVSIDKRPDNFSGDLITKVQVVDEIIHRLNLEKKFDNIAALLPTCPFRKSEDIVNAVNLFVNNLKYDFLISVTQYEFPIQLALNKSNNVVTMQNEKSYQTTRSQDIEKKYHPNGAIYIASIKAFIKNKSFFNQEMMCYEMSNLSSFDIDYPYQFEIAEIIAQKIKNNEL